MAKSLRDALLKAGLVTSEEVSRAERRRRSRSKPVAREVTREPTKHRAQEPPGSPPAHSPSTGNSGTDRKEHSKQHNLKIRHILNAEKENTEGEDNTPFHFTHGNRIKRIYVNEDQRKRLSEGELAIVSFRGRHYLVPDSTGEQIHALRPEVFVFTTTGESDPDADATDGPKIPNDLRW